MFILLGTSADVMLPHHREPLPVRAVSPAVAQPSPRAVERHRSAPRVAAWPVAVAGSPTRGIEFLKSAERQDARRQMVRAH